MIFLSNSNLVSYTLLSPNTYGKRNRKIDTVTIHCVVGQLSVEAICKLFKPTARKASCNYAIGTDGRIGLCVEEDTASQCSSSETNDQRAITIECASDTSHPYAINDRVMVSLVDLLTDICRRNPGIPELRWKGQESLVGRVSQQNITCHRWFAPKACPGDYIYNRLGKIASEVNAKLKTKPVSQDIFRVRKSWEDEHSQIGAYSILENAKAVCDANYGFKVYDSLGREVYPVDKKEKPFRVLVSINNLSIRKGPGINYDKHKIYTGKGVFTIVEVQPGLGSSNGWGLLKTYQKNRDGWISLDYAERTL